MRHARNPSYRTHLEPLVALTLTSGMSVVGLAISSSSLSSILDLFLLLPRILLAAEGGLLPLDEILRAEDARPSMDGVSK